MAEIIQITIEEIPPPPDAPKKRGRPVGTVYKPERWIDGKYNKAPLDPEYFKKYWANQPRVKCELCDRIVVGAKLSKHMNNQVCRSIQTYFQQQATTN